MYRGCAFEVNTVEVLYIILLITYTASVLHNDVNRSFLPVCNCVRQHFSPVEKEGEREEQLPYSCDWTIIKWTSTTAASPTQLLAPPSHWPHPAVSPTQLLAPPSCRLCTAASYMLQWPYVYITHPFFACFSTAKRSPSLRFSSASVKRFWSSGHMTVT